MIPLKFILAFLSIIITGLSITGLLIRNLKKLFLFELLAISFGIGCGFICIEMFLMSLCKFKFSILNLLIIQFPFHILFILGLLKNKIQIREFNKFRWRPSFFKIIIILFICFNIAFVILSAIMLPFQAWDSWTHWGYKAKVFFTQESIDTRIFKDFTEGGCYNPDYPLLIPLLESYVWFFLGTLHEPCAKLIVALYYIALVVFVYSALKKTLGDLPAGIGAFILSSIPGLITLAPVGYADVVMGFYITAAVIYIWFFLLSAEINLKNLLLGGIFLGLGMWVKNEGLSHWVAVILILSLLLAIKQIRISKRLILSVLVLPLLLISPWLLFTASFGVLRFSHVHPIESSALSEGTRLPMIFAMFLREFIRFDAWNYLWILFFIVILSLFKSLKKENFFLAVFILLQMLIYVTIYFVTPGEISNLQWNIQNTLSRILIQLSPIALFFIFQQIGALFSINNKPK